MLWGKLMVRKNLLGRGVCGGGCGVVAEVYMMVVSRQGGFGRGGRDVGGCCGRQQRRPRTGQLGLGFSSRILGIGVHVSDTKQ
ncbi:pollen-specific leucine-rich repeat extensin-like protein 4 [Iris pallida]|uniref:Pollen-specific leucine-rich repeat extensin-like protein 4 n=1 Tax=Iris pallida TaxID=29817 RepID=A0AAX6FG92_IRIPA|nr:pollen-specific leucine-rich repeat extensin-like protein 4 [Iris pallida]